MAFSVPCQHFRCSGKKKPSPTDSLLPWRCARETQLTTDILSWEFMFSSLDKHHWCASHPSQGWTSAPSKRGMFVLIMRITWDKCRAFLSNLGGINANRCQKFTKCHLVEGPTECECEKHIIYPCRSGLVILRKKPFIRQIKPQKDTQGRRGHGTHSAPTHWHFPGFNGG